MKRHALPALALLALTPFCAPALAAEGAHWGYEDATGPAKWGDLDAANTACAIGAQQSPVDIANTVRADLPALKITWPQNVDTIINNGHTIQLNFPAGGSVTLGDSSYQLLQVHFHHPSEHSIAGKRFPMEAHFVHRAESGAIAVVGVLIEEGKANDVFHKIVQAMPATHGPAAKPASTEMNLQGLLPRNLSYYRYSGSLTTPPCSEVVEWVLLNEPVQADAADIAAFAKLYPMNARPVQKDNRRFILQSH